MVPASTRQSPFSSLSSFSNSFSTFSMLIAGPCPLISVSCSALIFTLMRLMPSGSFMKSVATPIFFTPSSISFPVKPATNPNATESTPMFFKTVETLMPLPP